MLYLRSFCEKERILHVDAKVADRALDLRVAEQDLHSTEIARPLVDDGRLRLAERVGPVILRAQPDPGYPLVDQSSILPGADVIGAVGPARKDELVQRAAPAFQPCQHAAAGRLGKLELNRPADLLLDNDRT